MTIELPADLPPAALEVFEDLLKLYRSKYTGTYRLDINAGVPAVRRFEDIKKFGRKNKDR